MLRLRGYRKIFHRSYTREIDLMPDTNALLLKLRAYEVAHLLPEYTEDDVEHDLFVIESYRNIDRKEGGSRRVAGRIKKARPAGK